MTFNLVVLEGYVMALSPIHHGGDEKTGSESLLRRNKYFVNGNSMEIPYISGNALRGMWRRHLIADLLDRLDVDLKSTRLYHSLFSGGVLEQVSEKNSGVIDIELKKKLNDLLPPIRLLGTSYLNQTIEGNLQVGFLLPVCKELKEYLPDTIAEKYNDRLERSIFTFCDFKFQTRKDDLGAERAEGESAVQMLIKYEVFIPGTVFYNEIKIVDAEPLDISLLGHLIELWNQNPTIGGKASAGLGQLKLDYALDTRFDPELYLEFVEDNKKEIIQLLKELK